MLSLVVYFNKKNSNINQKFLSNVPHLVKNSVKKIEFIFIVQETSSTFIQNISKLESMFLELKIKIIFCNKTLSFNQQIKYALKQTNKKYIWILNSTSKYLESDILNILKVVEKKDVDIIEMKFKLNGLVKWNPKDRMIIKPLTEMNFARENKIIAYTFPLVFNKVFSRKQMLKILDSNLLNINKDSSSNLSIEFLYLFLLNAKSYIWLSKNIISINVQEGDVVNYQYVVNEWDRIQEAYNKEIKYISEIKYAKAYYLQFILTSLYGNKKKKMPFNNEHQKLFLNKYYEKILKIKKEEFENFNIDNKYMLNSNSENILLRNIQPIGKWNKLFSLLEK